MADNEYREDDTREWPKLFMRRIKKYFVVGFLWGLAFSWPVYAQTRVLDSLEHILKSSKKEKKPEILHQLTRICFSIDHSRAIKYAERASVLAKELKNPENSYSMHEVILKNNDVIYLFSDGYADQFGGEKEKKFKYSQMKELFLKIYKKEIKTQVDILDQTLQEWKGDLEQIDDILVIGLKIKTS